MKNACLGCGLYDGIHWHWCKQNPVEEWAGFMQTRKMTREELEKEFPRGAAAPERSPDADKT